jgi:hypothetical protein
VYSSTNRTPEDICRRWRSDVRPYSVPARSGAYALAGSSTDRMRPSARAIPTSMAVTVLAIDHEVKRCRSFRAYWYRSRRIVSPRATRRPVVG